MKKLSSTETIIVAVVETDTNIDRIAYVAEYSPDMTDDIEAIKEDVRQHYPACTLIDLILVDPIVDYKASIL